MELLEALDKLPQSALARRLNVINDYLTIHAMVGIDIGHYGIVNISIDDDASESILETLADKLNLDCNRVPPDPSQ